MDRRSGQIVGLDAVRFGAAALVMLYHLFFWSWAAGRATDGGPALAPLAAWSTIFRFGWVGVQVFFVLSGVVIAYSAAHSTATAFLKGRFLRLAPAIWVCAPISLLLPALAGAGQPGPATLLAHTLVLWPMGPWVDIVYWTLGVEVAFYALVWALLASGRFARIETAAWLLLAWSGVAWAAWALTSGHAHEVVAAFLGRRTMALLLVRHGCFFALGVFFWLIAFRGVSRSRVAGAAVALAPCLCEIVAASNGSPIPPVTIWLVSVAGIGAAMRWREAQPAARAFRMLGLMTFPLYLVHNAAGTAVMRMLQDRGVSPLVSAMVASMLALGVAWFVAATAEPAMRRGLRAMPSLSLQRAPSRA